MSRKTSVLIGWFAVVVMFGVSHVSDAAPQPASMPADVIELSCSKPLRISNVYVNRSQVAIYGKFEITFDLDGRWDNPFDPTQVKVDGEFTSPGGKVVIVPGFFYQEYKRTLKGGEDSYKPVGKPMWKVRFAPTEPGEYSYRVKVINRSQTASTNTSTLTCSPHTANHGFVRISKTNPLYLEYDDGTPFFALAHCTWYDSVGEVETFFDEFARAGGNMTRNFVSRIGEMVDPPAPRPDRGFGRMDLDRAWRYDQVFEQCERLGITHQLALANGTYFVGVTARRWGMMVYNQVHGGPLAGSMSGKEYLTNPQVRANFKRVLRYFVARWAYSTSVFSWDLWNEINLIPEYGSLGNEARDWHVEMAHYLREIDWAGHVIHTNFNVINGDPGLDSLPEMDMVSTNTYTQMDFASAAETWIRRHVASYGKPVMFSEFGLGHNYGSQAEGYASHDPDRIMIHNGIWSAMMNGSVGTGMPIDWNWLQHERYYRYLRATKRYVDGVPFCKRAWQPIVVESFRFRDTTQAFYYADAFVEGWASNYRFPPGFRKPGVFEIGADGRVKDRDSMSGYLGPMGRKTITLKMDYPRAGKFVVFVREVFLSRVHPSPPRLVAALDGRVVVDQELAVDPTASLKIYQQYHFGVPRGPHTIVIENRGGCSLATAYELTIHESREFIS
ncbi:MAG: DUF5060 domain-containing protein, partial [Planctomycetota bacterium]|nr:DUF5060 domain-containing protein [Planctomycetota bacterium]